MDKKDLNAKIAHDIWSHWMKYFFTLCSQNGPNGTLTIPNNQVENWKRLMNTEFEDLTDKEKKSDYEIAERFLKDF